MIASEPKNYIAIKNLYMYITLVGSHVFLTFINFFKWDFSELFEQSDNFGFYFLLEELVVIRYLKS